MGLWERCPLSNPRCEVLAAAEVYKIMAAAEALATDLKSVDDLQGWASYGQSLMLKKKQP